jgi:cephalosporin-C deacetylase-like acetyl esterase
MACFVAAPLGTDAQPASAQQFIFTPFHANGIYERGESAGWTVTAPDGVTRPVTNYTYLVKKNNFDIIKTGALNFSSGRAVIQATLDEPAMLYVEVRGRGQKVHLGAAIDPQGLKPSVSAPRDFDSFWEGELKALAQVPINPNLAPRSNNLPGVDLYTITLDGLRSHVRGYLAKPAREGKFPALIIFQYAGVYALQPETVTGRAAEGWLALDVDSHDIPPDQATGVSKHYAMTGNTDREASYFLNMYLRDSRAVDYIASRPDWDGRTIVVLGTSMGGQQSFAAAALNSKVTAVIVNEPSGADSNGELYGRKTGYPNWPSGDPDVLKTALYFDIVNLARRIKAPVLAAAGFIDTTAPPAGIFTALNQIPGPKEVIPMVESDHNNITPDKQDAFHTRSEEVLRAILAGATFHPTQPSPSGR